ncbi:MAG: DUF2201 family putative metallopeptidase [Pseudomonadota bacterium]
MTFAPRTPNEEEQHLKKRMEKLCEADRAWLLTSQPFTAKLLMQLKLTALVDDRLPTAGTDGESIFFNAVFMAGRSDEDRRFILAHEVWHCALGHHRRQLSRANERWNHACDYEINALLNEELDHCPEDALFDRRFHGQSAEQIYALLGQKNRRLRGCVLDIHDVQLALQAHKGEVHDPDFIPISVSAENARAWQQRLVATAQQVEREQGTLPGHVARLVERLRKPVIPWQQLLAQLIQKTMSGNRQWLPPSRRHIHRGLYLPSQRSQTLSLAVAIDTSGSCQRDLPHFLSELVGILGACDRVTVNAMEFDTRITQQRHLHEGQLHELSHWQCCGGGGSDVRPVFTVLEASTPELLVVFTDGFVTVPDTPPNYTVIWCLSEVGQSPADWGERVDLSP